MNKNQNLQQVEAIFAALTDPAVSPEIKQQLMNVLIGPKGHTAKGAMSGGAAAGGLVGGLGSGLVDYLKNKKLKGAGISGAIGGLAGASIGAASGRGAAKVFPDQFGDPLL